MSGEREDDKETPLNFVHRDDLSALALDDLIGESTVIDCEYVAAQLRAAAQKFPDIATKQAIVLLADIADIAMQFEDPAEPFGPATVFRGKRSLIPSDLRGKQNEHLAEFAPLIANPSLRARVADVVWINDRKLTNMADLAINSYLARVYEHLNGEANFEYESDSPVDYQILALMRRALQISKATKGKRAFPTRLVEALKRLNGIASTQNDIASITRLARLSLDFSVEENLDIACRIEKALEVLDDCDPHLRKLALEQLQRAYHRSKKYDQSNDCQIRIAECSVDMSNRMSASAMAAAHWLMIAIAELRQATGEVAKNRTKEIRKIHRDMQEDTVFEMVRHSHPLEIEDLVASTKEAVSDLPLKDALSYFISFHRSSDPDKLLAQAQRTAIKFPLSSLFGASHLDAEGKIVAKSESSEFAAEGSKDKLRDHILRDMKTVRTIVVGSQIEPVRRYIQSELAISQDELMVIAQHSPFVPPFHEHQFSLGFFRFFQGDMVSAASILLPQLENSLRYVLKTSGKDTSTIESDLTQDDRSISKLLEYEREQLEAMFGKDIVFEMDYLFNIRPGPALRHEAAHGKFADGHFYSEDIVYACWFLFQLACLPLLQHWDEVFSYINDSNK